MGHYNFFVVRIWTEEGQKTIRGYIQHVSTKEDEYFPSLDKMVEFIVGHLGSQANHLTEEQGSDDSV
jgi:hypothetical protein